MPDTVYQVALQGDTNLPRDTSVNVLVFATDAVEATMDELAALYAGTSSLFHSFFCGNDMIIKAYALSGGQPILQKTYQGPGVSSGDGPTEVALCLSYATVDDPDLAGARRRGRIYLPFGGAATLRPTAGQIGIVLDFGEALAQVGVGTAQTWKMWSRTDSATFDIESIWCDDSWDTQRRRGNEPTARTVRDVQ